MRNMLATLLLSQGTPLLVAGDEFGRTQSGNNNAYCQDNTISWLDWDVPAWGQSQMALVQRLIKLRHDYPILRRGRFFTGEEMAGAGVKDVTWCRADGTEMAWWDWQDPALACLGMLIDGRAQATGIKRPGADTTMLLLMNAYPHPVEFALPPATGGKGWHRVLDTAAPDRLTEDLFPIFAPYEVPSRTLLVFALHA